MLEKGTWEIEMLMKRTKAGHADLLMSALSISPTNDSWQEKWSGRQGDNSVLSVSRWTQAEQSYCLVTELGCYQRHSCVCVFVCFVNAHARLRAFAHTIVWVALRHAACKTTVSASSLSRPISLDIQQKFQNNFSPFASFSFAYLSFNRQHFLCLLGFLRLQWCHTCKIIG